MKCMLMPESFSGIFFLISNKLIIRIKNDKLN